MGERVRQFNGEMNIKSDGRGTTISFIFRLPATETPIPEGSGINQQVQAPGQNGALSQSELNSAR
jgi:hypothetical protein